MTLTIKQYLKKYLKPINGFGVRADEVDRFFLLSKFMNNWKYKTAYNGLTSIELIINREDIYVIEKDSALFFAKTRDISVFQVITNGYKSKMESLDIEVLKLLIDNVPPNDINYILSKPKRRIRNIINRIENDLDRHPQEKTKYMIIDIINDEPNITVIDLALELGVSVRVIKHHLNNIGLNKKRKKQEIIEDYFKLNPNHTKTQASKDLGISRTTIHKYT